MPLQNQLPLLNNKRPASGDDQVEIKKPRLENVSHMPGINMDENSAPAEMTDLRSTLSQDYYIFNDQHFLNLALSIFKLFSMVLCNLSKK